MIKDTNIKYGTIKETPKDKAEIANIGYKVKELFKQKQEMNNEVNNQNSGLEDKILEYQDLHRTGSLIDKIDRVTATAKLGLYFLGPAGFLIAKLIDIPELVFKGLYGLYYAIKTKDVGALPRWTLYEGLSTLIPFGNILDYNNNYKNRVEKHIKKKFGNEYTKYLSEYAKT